MIVWRRFLIATKISQRDEGEERAARDLRRRVDGELPLQPAGRRPRDRGGGDVQLTPASRAQCRPWVGPESLKILPGIHDPERVEDTLDLPHQRHQVAVLELERRDLALADAVLAGARAAARERVDDQPLDELVGDRQLGRIVGVELEADVEVAVAGMAEDRRLEAEALHLGAGERDRAGQLGDGDAGVGGALVPSRRGCGHRVGRVVPGRPQLGSAGRITLVDDLGGSLRLGQLAHERQVGLDRGLGAAGLDEQARALGIVRAAVGVDRRERRGVEQLEP